MQSHKARKMGRSPADMIGIILVAFVLGVIFFQSDSYSVDYGSKETYWVKTTWWGLKKEQHEIKWSGSSWQAKDKQGNWYQVIVDGDQIPEEYPHTR